MKPTARKIEDVLSRSLPSASNEQVESARFEVYEYARSMVGSHYRAARERVDEHGEPQPLPVTRWALVAAVVLLLGLAPFLAIYPVEESRQVSVSSAEALMDSVNGHLSRTIPAPMEPMMSLLPGDEVEIVWGGVQ